MFVSIPGTLVPSDTTVMAVICSLICDTQPKCAATSPITAVRTPMQHMDMTKDGQPLHFSASEERPSCVLVWGGLVSIGKENGKELFLFNSGQTHSAISIR